MSGETVYWGRPTGIACDSRKWARRAGKLCEMDGRLVWMGEIVAMSQIVVGGFVAQPPEPDAYIGLPLTWANQRRPASRRLHASAGPDSSRRRDLYHAYCDTFGKLRYSSNPHLYMQL